MTRRQYQAARQALGLSQSGVARLVGVDARTARRWEIDGPPAPVARFLTYLVATDADIDQVETIINEAKL